MAGCVIARAAERLGSSPSSERNGHAHDLSSVEDCVAMYTDGVDTVKAIAEAERARHGDAAWLKKFAYEAVWRGKGAFKVGNAEGCGGDVQAELERAREG